MENTTTAAPTQVDLARDIVEIALRQYAEHAAKQAANSVDISGFIADMDLALKMADNVKGWTHTTRLREFLEGLAR